MSRTKVLLVEINEITWDLIDPLIEQGKLPTFAWLKRNGSWAAPMSVDLPPHLDPWITWTTLYTGRRQEEHNVYFLQQPPETIRTQRIWEICHEHGLSVGVYGSLCSWPPKEVNGFYVPDTFAPEPTTYPETLSPIQVLNLTFTRSVRRDKDQGGAWLKAQLGAKLLSLGLSPATISAVVRQLATERKNPSLKWQRAALQPLVNFDFFSHLYRKHRPQFATFHTNHVAHYQHTYWKAMQPQAFPQATSEKEVETYGGAIEFGYRTADRLLQRLLELRDSETVMVVASSMGQKPFVSPLKEGKAIRELRSLDRLLQILGVEGRAKALATMSGQFNIYPETPEIGEEVLQALRAATIGSPDQPMFATQTIDGGITASLRPYDGINDETPCCFLLRGGEQRFRHADLIHSTGLVKSGCHDPKGMMLLYGPGIRAGGHVPDCNNLDIAPTLLTLLGLPVPSEMPGRVLRDPLAQASELAMAS
jgi:hypothetical protein